MDSPEDSKQDQIQIRRLPASPYRGSVTEHSAVLIRNSYKLEKKFIWQIQTDKTCDILKYLHFWAK